LHVYFLHSLYKEREMKLRSDGRSQILLKGCGLHFVFGYINCSLSAKYTKIFNLKHLLIEEKSNKLQENIIHFCMKWKQLRNCVHYSKLNSLAFMRSPEFPCRKILRYVKDPLTYLRHWCVKFSSLVHFSYSISDVSAGRIAREFCWTSQEFSPAGVIITMALHTRISPPGWKISPFVVAVLRRKSRHIDTINQSCSGIRRLDRTLVES
jgi:hypothetical protein